MPAPRRRHAGQGFATLEVLVAVAVVVAISTLSVLSFGRTDRRAVTTEAAALALFLQQERIRSLETGRNVQILVLERENAVQAGNQRFDAARNVQVSSQIARATLRPSGENEGLVIELVKNDVSTRVVVDWLTGRVILQ
ncbi:MAG: hypothetical protein AAF636_08305 [Pseudomonadota bacterium]